VGSLEQGEPAAETAEHAKKHGFDFFVVKDPGNKVADAYGAQKTPEVFLLDAAEADLSRRIDENQDDANAVRSPDFRNALDALLAGKPSRSRRRRRSAARSNGFESRRRPSSRPRSPFSRRRAAPPSR